MKDSGSTSADKVRLDKWLWAARLFKTRSLAKQAIEGGKVHYNGARCKVSKDVDIGATLKLRQGWDEKEIEVLGLSDQRRGAPEAQRLYRETEASASKRQLLAEQRKAEQSHLASRERPTKKQRRQIHRFRREQDTP